MNVKMFDQLLESIAHGTLARSLVDMCTSLLRGKMRHKSRQIKQITPNYMAHVNICLMSA